jgi:GNAT superfamily N-acetyltransferase
MTPWTVRPARPGDAPAVAEFNRRLAWETERKTLDPATLGRGVATLIADPAKGFYRIAEAHAGADPAGQLLVTFEWSDWRDGWFWWLQSVYVASECRGRGVFAALLASVEAEAISRNDVVGLRLYMETDNAAGRRAYEKAGLREQPYRLFEKAVGRESRDSPRKTVDAPPASLGD